MNTVKDLYKLYTKNFLVDTDTRSIRRGTIFFALKGDNFNGNKFAEEALSKGADYAIVDEKEYQTDDSIILVTNVLESLQELARFHREQLKISIIGLTGSNGKTTTKELITAVLNEKYNVTATKGNLNNHIGVPLTLLSMNLNTEIGVVEMGANNHNEIASLSEISRPDYGYITNFGKAHLEGFGSIDGVVKAKSELYDFLKVNNKIAIVNPNDEKQLDKTTNIKRVLFNSSINFLKASPFVELEFNDIFIKSNLIGKYNFSNISAAITIGELLGVSSLNIKKALENYIPSNNRSQIINKKGFKIILDAYNANPTSMEYALDSFNELVGSEKLVILGDMFELGDGALKEHQLIANKAEGFSFAKTILVGENFFDVTTNLDRFKTFLELKEFIKSETISEGTIIFIKGSRGMALERIVDFL
ncbi:UDP-N-acetylmuramoyl-tripeptide--D-alanyl-D-alanine ligase [uncultured Tenacibaculum sp.]|uniref:UDP-N-acetylmuramoyl-tripeptide--D-alanyl-D- alanine ligase n=1 Tax=uncultured Tenacibaculum sp. TaxID=174713 RepID=UPI0026053DA2|nr:UDP-N-acetylmuramoyl-tripeptide--D-alanyl-D-alanine ligase [uncultured Tenacibaculum sp.]